MFDMEADRIRDLSFDPKIVESERGVVYSERRSGVDNNPFGALYEQLNATAFVAHPYQFPVIGWPSDIESWSMEDLKAHFKMGYAPNNCVLVITGDVKPAEVLALAKKYLEPIPRQEPPPPVRTREPEQQGERRVELRRAAALPIVLVSYHSPETKSPESPALQVMSTILSGGRSSRLTRRLVDQEQIALSVNMGPQQSLDPGQIMVSMQVRSGKDPKQAEALLYEELEKLGRDGVTAEELEKSKNQILAEYYRGLRTIAGKANLIGNYEVFRGGWQNLAETEKLIRSVSAEDVKKAAAKYLTAKNRTVGTLIPEAAARKEAGR
jgi:zinc protease